MKTIKMIGLVFVTCMLFSPMSAEANGYDGWGRHNSHHGHHMQHGHGWGARVFWSVPGAMLYYSPYTYSYNPYPSTVIVQQATPSVQAPAPVIQQSQQPQYWYFCDSANVYYPSVDSCQEGWRMIPVTPPLR